MIYIGSDSPPVDWVRQVVQTCGRNAVVVSVAAPRPRSVTESMGRASERRAERRSCPDAVLRGEHKELSVYETLREIVRGVSEEVRFRGTVSPIYN